MEYDAHMKYGLLIILLVTSFAQAQVYRTVDKNGNVIFSDVEEDNAEEVIIDIAPSYTAPTIIPTQEIEQELDNAVIEVPKYKVTITSPAHNETFQNPESIDVIVNVSPELNIPRADNILFKLDGKAIGSAQSATSTTLTGLERGSHILVASVVDKTGKVIKSSKSVLFHIQRHSITRQKRN